MQLAVHRLAAGVEAVRMLDSATGTAFEVDALGIMAYVGEKGSLSVLIACAEFKPPALSRGGGIHLSAAFGTRSAGEVSRILLGRSPARIGGR